MAKSVHSKDKRASDVLVKELAHFKAFLKSHAKLLYAIGKL
jgi:hypothetical protein